MSFIEPLEARIAPAVVITNPLPNLTADSTKNSTTLDLTQLTATASSSAYHTKVKFTTNFDTDPNTAGIQNGVITIELYDDLAPLTVQNFLSYVNNANDRGDYDDTLFHRAVPGFILQSGGFEATSSSTHIPVGLPVHNEASSARSNVEGTVAMAKVSSADGGGPNSATSEWFVNIADNSGNLDNQNGGFTVFGKVDTAGLAVVKSIVALVTTEGAPTQGGVAIKVLTAEVVPSTSTATGLTYTVDSVTPVGATPADLISTSIANGKLTVSYPGNKSGLTNVTVKVSDGTTSALDTFQVEVRPNYIVEIAGSRTTVQSQLSGDKLPAWLVPADAGKVSVKISNSGGSVGGGKVQFFLTAVDVTTNSLGQIVQATDVSPAVTIAATGTADFSVASGASQTLTVPLKLPTTSFGGSEHYFRVVAQVVPADTVLNQEELFADDNTSTQNSVHAVNYFGKLSDSNFGTRSTALKYISTGTDGRPASSIWAISGVGSGSIDFDAQGNAVSLNVQDTTFKSTLATKFTKNASRPNLSRIDIAAPVGTASLATIDLHGPLTASGGVKTLLLGDVTGQSLFSIGAALSDERVKASVSMRNVTNLSLASDQPLAGLTVASWLDTDANNDSIVAPSLGKLVVSGIGNFEADVTLTDPAVKVTSIAIGGFLRNANIQAAGNIGTVKLGGINKGSVFAGVTARPTSFPADVTPHSISTFTIAGIKGVTTPLFIDSQVAAQTIGTIKVTGVATTQASGATDSGFVADVIGSYARPGFVTQKKVTTPRIFDDAVDGTGGYAVKVV